MRTRIYTNEIWGEVKFEEKDLTKKEIFNLRQNIKRNLANWFTWEAYNDKFRHLVISAEFDNLVVVYKNGYLMDEEDFENNVSSRNDILFADVKHRI